LFGFVITTTLLLIALDFLPHLQWRRWIWFSHWVWYVV